MTRRTFIKRGLAATAFLGCGAAAYAGEFERHGVSIEPVRISLGLPTPLRAALLSDIHFDPLYETDWLRSVFSTIAGLSPDLMFYTGDYVTRTTARFAEFGAIAGGLRPRYGSYAALGNHDHWSGRSEVQSVLQANGIRVLKNATVPLPQNPGWAIVGLDSYWAGRPRPEVVARWPADTCFISLVHEPDAWDKLPDSRMRLQLSGHTHGGQVRAPFLGALRLPTWGKKYDAGLFTRGDRHLYVNRGLGTVSVPCRVNCSPEITLFELT